jgi:hypothetical protein
MSGERLDIDKDGNVIGIGPHYQFDSSPYLAPPTIAISPSQDMGYNNIYSMSHDIDGKMRITGDDADIEIDGISLKKTLHKLQERMAILEPNLELEQEFKELKDIRKKYIELERNLLEKKAIWQALNQDD